MVVISGPGPTFREKESSYWLLCSLRMPSDWPLSLASPAGSAAPSRAKGLPKPNLQPLPALSLPALCVLPIWLWKACVALSGSRFPSGTGGVDLSSYQILKRIVCS